MDIELLHKNPTIIEPTLKDDALQFVFDVAYARAYRFMVDTRSNKTLHAVKSALLIVCLSDTEAGIEVNGKTLYKKGDFNFIQPQQLHHYINHDEKNIELAVIEIK